MRPAGCLFALAIGGTLLPAPVHADVGVGLTLELGSFSAGAGPVACAGCDYENGSLSGRLHVSWLYSSRIRIGANVATSLQSVEAAGQRVILKYSGVVTAEYRLGDFWVGGGVGPAFLYAFGTPGQTIGPGVELDGGVRYEPFRWGAFVPHVALGFGVAAFPAPWQPTTQVLLGLGGSWHSGVER